MIKIVATQKSLSLNLSKFFFTLLEIQFYHNSASRIFSWFTMKVDTAWYSFFLNNRATGEVVVQMRCEGGWLR